MEKPKLPRHLWMVSMLYLTKRISSTLESFWETFALQNIIPLVISNWIYPTLKVPLFPSDCKDSLRWPGHTYHKGKWQEYWPCRRAQAWSGNPSLEAVHLCFHGTCHANNMEDLEWIIFTLSTGLVSIGALGLCMEFISTTAIPTRNLSHFIAGSFLRQFLGLFIPVFPSGSSLHFPFQAHKLSEKKKSNLCNKNQTKT